MTIRDTGRRAVLAGLGLLAAQPARQGVAQGTFPQRPIRLVVPFGPGGATDFAARSFAQRLAEMTGWSIVIENRAGAGGNIGADAVAKAAPDGHTWLLSTVGIVATNPVLYDSLPFDPRRDFRAIGVLAQLPNLLVAGPSLPARTLAEFLQAAAARPGGLTYSSSGNGTTSHLCGELLRLSTRANLVHVPYRAAGQAHADIIGGRVDFTIDNLPAVLPYVRAGQMAPIAVTGGTRDASLPDTPTVIEAGVPGYEVNSWFALVLPAAVPDPVASQIEAVTRRALADPALRTAWAERGLEAGTRFGPDYEALAEAEQARWRDVIGRTGIRLQ